MSDTETRPDEVVCEPAPGPGPVIELYPAREVPLGGVRGVFVERVLPQRDLPTVGAWCFFDHFGSPTVTRTDAPPDIDPHPHIGLQTVTWPFVGRIRHRDSVGSDVEIHPGQLNLMTAGRGVAHSEYYPADAPAGHGLQLWIALPGDRADIAPHFEQHRDLPVHTAPGLRATVLIGSLAGYTSPARAYTPLVGADVVLDPDTSATLPLDTRFEYAIMLIDGDLTAAGTALAPGPLLYLGTERAELRLESTGGAHFLLIGGEPFGEELVMWWNFVGRGHEEIVTARADWENHDVTRFPDIAGHTPDQRIPVPPLPGLHLKPRKRRMGAARS
ncbi:pirin family protein [Nocardia arizonensis]|uniref:pirin family protein n=1 Tax=Nocardia arizonensis TaxID=1141647 RepID=UPI0006D28E42|nr:pirin family protein [Nocardia arizonensis]